MIEPSGPLIRCWLQPILVIGSLTVLFIFHRVFGTCPPESPALVGLPALGLLLWLQTKFPFKNEWRPSARDLKSSIAWFAVYFFWGPAVVFGLKILSDKWYAGMRIAIWPNQQFLLKIILAWFLVELVNYCYHRLAHNFRLLWIYAAHGTHHSPKKMNSLVGLLNHPFEYFLLTLPGFILVGIFGADEETLNAVVSLTTLQVFLVHSNLAVDTPFLRWFLTQPYQHWLHHTDVLSAQNSNFSCTLIFWDRIFGTFNKHTIPIGVGLGISPDATLTLRDQFLFPFHPKFSDQQRFWPESRDS